jgi:prolipoprotein diacylglyceryltransferase
MPDVLQIGPLQLQGRLLALLLACVVGLWLIRRQVRQSQDEIKLPIDDIIFNAAIIVVLTWKFGIVLTQPSILWTQPTKLLMISGSNTEMMFGLLFALIYGFFQLRKRRIPLILFLDVLASGLTVSFFLYIALIPEYGLPTTLPWGIGVEGTVSRFHPYHMYLALLLVPFLIWQQFIQPRAKTLGSGKLLKYSMLYVGAAGMLASFFADPGRAVVYLSWHQLIFLFMLVIGMLLRPMVHNTSRRELSQMSQNDSKTQIEQEKQNKEHQKFSSTSGKEGFVDKKLDGPNRPST